MRNGGIFLYVNFAVFALNKGFRFPLRLFGKLAGAGLAQHETWYVNKVLESWRVKTNLIFIFIGNLDCSREVN